jgi:L-iditol 2-dehydrogenase
MRALVKEQPGPGGLAVREIAEPAPAAGQVVIAVHAAGICGSDLHIRHGRPPVEMRYPVALGHEFAGVVDAVGPGVTGVRPGDRVVSETTFHRCGACPACLRGAYTVCPDRRTVGTWHHGAFASRVLVPDWAVHRLRPETDTALAVLAEPLAVAAHGLVERTRIAPGERVLVTGPGPIGLAAWAVCRYAGASVAVAGAPADEVRLACARRLGAEAAGTLDDVRPWLAGGIDVLVECSGAPAALDEGVRHLRPGGRVVQLGLFGGRPVPLDLDWWVFHEITLITSLSQTHGSWEHAIRIVEEGDLDLSPMVSGLYPLDRWQEAFDAAEAKTSVKVLIVPDGSPLPSGAGALRAEGSLP